MKKKFTLLLAAVMLLVFMMPSMAGWGQTRTDYEAVITFDCASASANGNSTIYGGSTTTSMGPTHIKAFLNNAAGSTVINSNPSSYSSVYWAKGTGGSGIPDDVLKIGTSSGGGNCTFTIADSFDEISKVSITGYGWKNTTKVAVNGSATQSPSAAATEVTFDYVLSKPTRTIAISITTSAFCATEIVLYKEATSSVYTVTYDCNGGTSGCPENVTDIDPDDNEITLAAAPNRAGYTFVGWSDGTDTYSAGDPYTVVGDVTMTAQWTANTYAVTLPAADTYGTYTMNVSSPVAYDTEVILSYTPATGYEYYAATWSSDDVTITNGTFTMPNQAVIVTVSVEELPKYTVTYSDGGSVTEEHYSSGVELASRPGDGTYTFAGWTTSNIASETTDVPTIIPTNVTYYPTANITLFPVYTRTEGSGSKWVKTALSDVTAGTYAMITPSGYAFNGDMSSGHGQVTGSAFSFTNNEATEAPDGICELELSASGSGFTMKNNSTNKYLYASAASSGKLAWHDTESSYWRNNNGEWVYNSNTAYLRYYDGANGQSFRTYGNTSSGTGAIQLAKKVSNAVTYYVSSLTSIAIPTFNPTSKNFSTTSLSVTISAASGCVIKYTTNDWETETVTSTNSETIEITGTTTIKAMAKDGGSLSAEVSETYTRVYSVALISNGVEKSIEEVVPTESISLSAPDNVPQGFTFMGWTADPSTPNTLVNTEYTPTGNVTLYASFAKIISSSYDKVTSASDMTEGEYIIATYYGSKYYTIKSNTEVSSNPVAHEQAVTNNAITGDVTELTWSFTGTSDAMAIKSTTQNLYLNTTNSPTGVQINTTSNDSWTISFNSTDNYFSMKSTNGGGTRYLSVFISNGSPKDWRNYASGTTNSYQQITLFKKNAIVSENYYIQVQELPAGNSEIATVTPADLITVPSGAVLTITGACTGGPENLIIKDGGQLKVYTTGAKDGGVQATVEKYIGKYTADDNGWNFIASPLTSAFAPDATMTSNTYDLYQLNNTKWENWKKSTDPEHPSTNPEFKLINGRGYLYANSENVTLSFPGAVKPFNTVTPTANQVAVSAGWNLIGNPYTFNVFVNQPYYSISQAQAGITAQTTASNTDDIAPCTAVLVKANIAGYVTFYETLPSTSNNGNLNLVVAQAASNRGNATTLDNAIVSFNEDSQLGKFYFGSQDANLYIPMDNEEYAIVSSSAQGEMPVNFRAYVTGEYTITVNPEEVEMGYLHLIDNIAGVDVDLLANPSYTFNARYDDYESRFRLVFSANMVNADLNDDFAFFSNGQLVIANEGEAILQVIDVNGRIVATESINGTCSRAINAKAGVYVLRLINGTDVKTQKIIVK